MRTVHLRADSRTTPGATKDWIIQSEANQVTIRYGTTGKKLRKTVIGLDACSQGDPEKELVIRMDKKLIEGYEKVPLPGDAETVNDNLYVSIQALPTSIRNLHEDLAGYIGSDGMTITTSTLSAGVSTLTMEFDGDTVRFDESADTHMTARGPESEVIMALAVIKSAKVTGLSITTADDSGNVFDLEQVLRNNARLPPAVLKLAIALGVRTAPIQYATISAADGTHITPVLL